MARRLAVRGLPPLAVAAVVVALAAPFLSEPWHIDEPLFIAVARHILVDPFHPFSFDFNWYGRAAPMREIATNPPLFGYLLAAGWKISGGREWLLRLSLLPLDLVAAWSLFAIAARFLRRPLWPTLAVLAAPAYAVNMSHAMAEKLLAALAFPALYACLRGVDSRDDRYFWASAALFALALLTKFAGVFLLLPAVLYALRQGMPRRKVAGYWALACAPVCLYLMAASLGQARGGVAAVAHAYATTLHLDYATPMSRSRALLAFIGGCALVPAAWSLPLARPRLSQIAIGIGLAAILFWTGTSWPARATGVFFAAAALCALDNALSWRNAFFKDWTIAGALLLGAYGAIAERTALFLLPPLTFAAAQRLEALAGQRRLVRLYAPCVTAVAALTLALAAVDFRYARAQKSVAEWATQAYAAPGRTIWCASHWGLQHYLLERGARELDWTRGGWDAARSGDVVVLSRVNSNVLLPEKKIMAEMLPMRVGCEIPLRLISGWGGQAGFYSNKNGFLPFVVSREPLDEFLIARIK